MMTKRAALNLVEHEIKEYDIRRTRNVSGAVAFDTTEAVDALRVVLALADQALEGSS